jgi:hypothetical protein
LVENTLEGSESTAQRSVCKYEIDFRDFEAGGFTLRIEIQKEC